MTEKQLPLVPATRGPVLAALDCHNATVRITIDPSTPHIRATVRTRDTTGPSADAVREATVRLAGTRLTVTIPQPPTSATTYRSGGTVFNFSGGNLHIGNMSGGVINTGLGSAATVGASPVEVNLTLPAGSGVQMDGVNSHLHIQGPLAALEVNSTNGGVQAGVVGRIKARLTNGTCDLHAVQDEADIEVHNGNTSIGSYSGGHARITAHNGGIDMAVTPHAAGRLEAVAHNGSLTMRGTAGRRDLDLRARAHNGSAHVS